MKYEIVTTSRFKKDLKQMLKRGLQIDLMQEVVDRLAAGFELPEKNKDHALLGNWVNHRECHVMPDWILIYKITEDCLVLTLTRTGSHSDLFG